VTVVTVTGPPHQRLRVGLRAAPVTAVVAVAAAVAVSATWWPLLVIPGAVAVAVVVGALVRLDLALLLLAAAVPLEYSVALGGNPQLTVVKLAGALCFASFAVQLATRRRQLRLDATHAMLLGILSLILVATVAANALDGAALVTVRYASYVGMYFVLTAFAGDHRTLEQFVWVLSVASAIAGALAIRNLLTGFDTRATPTYGDPNDLAYILSTTLPLTLWLLRRRGPQRLAVLALVAVIGIADVLTLSRGAAVGLGCALVWALVTHRAQLRALAAPLLIVAACIGVVALTQQARITVALRDKGIVAASNVDHRFDAWRSALLIIEAHPLIGVGPGNFQLYTATVDNRPPAPADPTVVHNTYLEVGAEIGLPALALLLAYVLTSFRRLHTAVRRQTGPTSFAIAATASMIVAVTAALTLSEQYYAPLWMMGAIATCLWQEAKVRPDVAPVATAP
jgi:putative inorganic carbon (HCO3(-)) transporter